MKKSICILGAHRSGTSTVTRGLNLLGAYLGEEKDLMKPLPENPEGFWERYDIYYLQERMLSAIKRSWDATAPLPEGWHKSAEIRSLKDELVALVKNNFSGQQLWAWKDPRTCLLLPLWKDVLAELGIDLQVLFVVRNPLDVARSLEKRNGFTLDKGLGVWFNNTVTALQDVTDLGTVFLSYDRFLDDWETEMKRCAAGLGIAWPADEAALRAEMAPFVRRDLRHSVSGLDSLHEVAAPEPVIRLYTLLLDILAGRVALNAAAMVISPLYQEFCSYARLFEYDMAALAACRKLLDEKAVSAEMLPSFSELKKEFATRTEWALKLNDEVKSLKEQVTTLENSISWQITKLLRVLSALFSGHREKVTPHNFHHFTYSKRSHFQSLRRHKDHQPENINDCDLKIYQDMLVYNFILDNFPKGARLLEIGGCDSRVIRWLKHRYEFWNLDKLEGVGNGLTDLADTSGFRLVRDYIGSFSEELPDGYFDGVFSISVMEHVPKDPMTLESIHADIQRLLKPGGFSLHCIDTAIKKDGFMMHPLIDYLYGAVEMVNPRIGADVIRHDPDLWGMSAAAYNRSWKSVCKNLDYENFGIPFSFNLLWRKA